MTRYQEQQYRMALHTCFARYRDMADAGSELLRFINEALIEGHLLSVCKLNRWLGYVQGTLIAQGKTTVQIERDWTRPCFKPLDDQE